MINSIAALGIALSFVFGLCACGTSSSNSAIQVPPSPPSSPTGTTAINGVFPPLDSNDPTYSIYFSSVVPHLNGVNVTMAWNQIDNSTSPCQEGSQTDPCNWSGFEGPLLPYVNAGLKINLIVDAVSDVSPNISTPAYVFSPTYAASLGAPPQDQSVCGGWPNASNPPIQSTNGLSASGVWNASGSCYASSGSTCAGGSFSDTSGFPVLYEVPFITAYKNFMANVIKHYSSTGTGQGPQIAPNIGYIRFGMAQGGEDYPQCTQIWPGPGGMTAQPAPNGYSKAAYLTSGPGYISTMLSHIHSLQPAIKVAINAHAGPPTLSDLSYADTEAQLAAANNIGFGSDSLNIGDYYNYSQGQPCENDWCSLFNTYTGKGLELYLQGANPNSEPVYSINAISGNGQMATATCTEDCDIFTLIPGEPIQIVQNSNAGFNGYFDAFGQTQPSATFTFPSSTTGSGSGGLVYTADYLPTTIPFAVQRHATAIEIHACDLFYAYAPTQVTGCPAPGAYSSQYAQAISTASGK